MDEIQKAIDEAKTIIPVAVLKDGTFIYGYKFTGSELKSLLEKVAREQEISTLTTLGWPADDANSLLITDDIKFPEKKH